MRVRLALGAATVLATFVLPVTALGQSTGTVPGLRAQVSRLITAELHGDSATVCAILGTGLNGTEHGRSCTQRWDTKLAKHKHHAALRADLTAVASAAVSSDGVHASITLPHPLLAGRSAESSFSWYDNCWMLMR
jgi:hypothetical protein